MIKYNDIVLWDKRLKDGSEALASKDIAVVKSALSGVLSDMSEVRLIDANAYAAEMKERQDALKEGSE